MDEERWADIWNFPDYMVSSYGRIARQDGYIMSPSKTRDGHLKISLAEGGIRRTVSLRVLVADAFVPERSEAFDTVMCKDNDKENLHIWNLMWRPRWFAWKYFHQFKETYPPHYHDIPIINIDLNVTYGSVVEACQEEGALYTEVFRSCYSHEPIFPYWHRYALM